MNTKTIISLAVLLAATVAPAKAFDAYCTKVINGNTIEVVAGYEKPVPGFTAPSVTFTVHLRGVAPSKDKVAIAFIKKLCVDKVIDVYPMGQDKNGENIAWALMYPTHDSVNTWEQWTAQRNLSCILIGAGYGTHDKVNDNKTSLLYSVLDTQEAAAKKAHLGLWKKV